MQVNRFINMTSSVQVLPGRGTIEGFYVVTTSSGLLRLFHGATATNTGKIITTANWTPSAGWNYLGQLDCTAGLYVGLQSGSINGFWAIRDRD